MSFPVFFDEVMEAIDPRPGQVVVDCTVSQGRPASPLFSAFLGQTDSRQHANACDPTLATRRLRCGYPSRSDVAAP
jgi:16S rRNA C1402 N4-methylase RsmH